MVKKKKKCQGDKMIVLKLVLISAGLTKLKIKCSLVPWFLNYII